MDLGFIVLDAMHGRPADGVTVRLAAAVDGSWLELGTGLTDLSGCLDSWQEADGRAQPGVADLVRLDMETDAYFAALGLPSAFPKVSVLVRMPREPDALRLVVAITPSCYTIYGTR